MNQQPFGTPPQHWPPQLSPFWVRLFRPFRLRTLQRRQKILQIDFQGLEPLRQLLEQDAGVLLTPNHSFHYDSYCLFEAAHRLQRPFHFLTAWQVFAMSSKFERWSLQKHGCFSINRENNDLQAFRQAIRILEKSPYPLVIFPEGDIYHTNDRVTPFREGAAAIALSAARGASRPVYCVPAALKLWYIRDPEPELLQLMARLEQRLYWRPRPDLPLDQRVYRLAEGMLALKELEHLGAARAGPIVERRHQLIDAILKRQEMRYPTRPGDGSIPERVKELRRKQIEKMEDAHATTVERHQARGDLDDLFFVVQLYSYPGDYLLEKLTTERIAETLDKFEEDLLDASYPSVRGTRRVAVRFGAPVLVEKEKGRKGAAELTERLQQQVQQMLDEMNAAGPPRN